MKPGIQLMARIYLFTQVISLWSPARDLLFTISRSLSKTTGVVAVLGAVLFIAPGLLFYWELSRNTEPIQIAREFRRPSLVFATLLTLVLLSTIWSNIRDWMAAGSILPSGPGVRPGAAYWIDTVIQLASGAAGIAFFLVLAQVATETPPTRATVGRWLRLWSKGALAVGVLFAAWQAVGVGMLPVMYHRYQNLGESIGRPLPWTLTAAILKCIQGVVLALSTAAPPYFVLASEAKRARSDETEAGSVDEADAV